MISIQHAFKSFQQQVIFADLNLEIHEPGLYIMQGESGSGKTTLLNLLAGFESFDSGEIHIDENLATIFQNYELISELTIQENIFLTHRKIEPEQQRLIQKLGIEDLMNYYPKELSGGQKQRVGIARALFLNPNIICCDEPTESLDIENKRIVMNLLKELSRDRVVIVASHDQQMIDEYADEVFRLQHHQCISERQYHSHHPIQKQTLQGRKRSDIHRLIFHILKTRMIMISLILASISLLVLGLFVYEKKMFQVPTSTQMVNANMLYIEKNDEGIHLEEYGYDSPNIRPAIKFLSFSLNGIQTPADIFAYQNHDLPLIGHEPQKGEVVINQNVANVLKGQWENRSLEFTYSLNGRRYPVQFEICGVVEEESTGLSFYYNYEGMIETINEQQVLYEDALTFLNQHSTYFEMPLLYSLAFQKIERHVKEEPFELYNPLVAQRKEFMNSSRIYQLVFTVLELILFLGILVFIVLYFKKDTTYYLRICAILASLQFSLREIKQVYIIQKILAFVPLEILVIKLSLFFVDPVLKGNDLHIVELAMMVILAVYVLTLFACLSQLKMKRVSEILKESKDMS